MVLDSLMVPYLQYLKDLNNFHLLAAVVAGLGHCAVSRLKFTLARVSKSDLLKLKELEKLMSMESSYRTYRNHLLSVDLPAIPYMYLSFHLILLICFIFIIFTPTFRFFWQWSLLNRSYVHRRWKP